MLMSNVDVRREHVVIGVLRPVIGRTGIARTRRKLRCVEAPRDQGGAVEIVACVVAIVAMAPIIREQGDVPRRISPAQAVADALQPVSGVLVLEAVIERSVLEGAGFVKELVVTCAPTFSEPHSPRS